MPNGPLNFRFRRTFPIFGKWLKWTITKKGVSLNLHAGLFSRSWGTRGNTTTIDAPGHLGFFWRGQSRRGATRRGPKLTGEEQAIVAREHSQHLWRVIALTLIGLEGVIELLRIHAPALVEHCAYTGHVHWVLLTLVAAAVFVTLGIGARVKGFLLVLVAVAVIWAQWQLFNSMDAGSIHCGKTAAAQVHRAS